VISDTTAIPAKNRSSSRKFRRGRAIEVVMSPKSALPLSILQIANCDGVDSRYSTRQRPVDRMLRLSNRQ